MKLETNEKNGLLSIQLEAENRDEADFLRRVSTAKGKVLAILHKDPGFHFPTLTTQVSQ